MHRVYKTNILYRISCLIIAAYLVFAIYNSFINREFDSIISFVFSIILFQIFIFQSFYFESFVLQDDKFIYSKQFLFFTFKYVDIPYNAIVKLERIYNVQLITRYNIEYYIWSGQTAHFSMLIFKLLPYHLVRPNMDFIMNEISNLSRIKIKDTLI